jgi:FkbM family methyltransferase
MEIEGLNKISKFLKNNNISPKVILDIGARDMDESIFFSQKYPKAKIISFECNPNTLEICRNKIVDIENIQLIDKAVNEIDGTCDFYPINKEKTITTWEDGNQGASSLFLSNGSYPHEKYVQDKVTVECVRLDTILSKLNIGEVDLIWMDLQGAEMLALKSLGKFLENVKIIYTEVEMNPIYAGQCLFKDVNSFLTNNNFEFIDGNLNVTYGTDVIYMNNKYKNNIK